MENCGPSDDGAGKSTGPIGWVGAIVAVVALGVSIYDLVRQRGQNMGLANAPRSQSTCERSPGGDRAQAEQAEIDRGFGLKWVVEHVGALFAAAGLLVYGTVRLAYEGFYSTFNLSPESVGLSYAAILASAAPDLALYMLFVALYLGPFVVLGRVGYQIFSSDRRPVLAISVALVGIFLLVAGLGVILGTDALTIAFVSTPVFAMLVFLALDLYPTDQHGKGSSALSASAGGRNLSIILAAVALVFILAGAFNAGISAGYAAQTGGPIRLARPFDSFIRIPAEPVTLNWADRSNISMLPTKLADLEMRSTLTYLGKSDGTVVLLDRGNCNILQIPADSIILTETSFIPADSGCGT